MNTVYRHLCATPRAGMFGFVALCVLAFVGIFVGTSVPSIAETSAVWFGGLSCAALLAAGILLILQRPRPALPGPIPSDAEAALDAIVQGMLILDQTRRVVSANRAFTELVGQPKEALRGKAIDALPWANNASRRRAKFQANAGQGTAADGAPVSLRTTGGKREFELRAAPVGEGSAGRLLEFRTAGDSGAPASDVGQLLQSLVESREEIRRQNQELQVLANQDPLTSCLNRRCLFQSIASLWDSVQADGSPISCIMLDIDHFKSINDQHGHSTGDMVLREVGRILREAARGSDLVARYGGEEFCILLPRTDLEAAYRAAERLRKLVAGRDLPQCTVTASFGASSSELGARDPQTLIEQADQALYVAKDGGRNCVVRFDRREVSASAEPSRPQSEVADTIPFHAVTALVTALTHRDSGTADHSRRVADTAALLAQKLMPVRAAYIVEIAALLHDIGKIGVPDAILLKPGQLTGDEWKVMEVFKQTGLEIVQSVFASRQLTEIISQHHLWYGGRGDHAEEPRGEDLRLGARILAIADAFDSMTSDHNYRRGMSQAEAFAELRRCAGTQFDPELTETFIHIIGQTNLAESASSGQVSHASALNVGRQVERLAAAISKRDLEELLALATWLRQTSSREGEAAVAELAGRLEAAVRESNKEDFAHLIQLTNEIVTLCRQNGAAVTDPQGSQPCAAH